MIINWNDGRLIKLSAGDTAKCEGLRKKQLYAVLLYNTSPIDINAIVTVVWSNDVPPQQVTVLGTKNDQGTANFVFISGDDSRFISIALLQSAGQAEITALLVSITMPLNDQGINNIELTGDGNLYPFQKFDRYYTKIKKGWSNIIISNPVNQFISLQITKEQAIVIVVNEGVGLRDGQITKLGDVANKEGIVTIDNQTSSYSQPLQGDRSTWVWINGDSPQNSQKAQISLQTLSLAQIMLLQLDQ